MASVKIAPLPDVAPPLGFFSNLKMASSLQTGRVLPR